MGFDNLVKVFGCSVVSDSISKMFVFSTVPSSWAIIFDSVIGFNKSEAVLGCLTVTDFISSLLRLCTVSMFCQFF